MTETATTLRAWMSEKNVSVGLLSRSTGFHKRFIQRILAGDIDLHPGSLEKIVEVMERA